MTQHIRATAFGDDHSVLLRQPKPFVVESEVFRFSEETGPFVGFVRRLRPFPSTLRLQLDLVSHDSSGTEAMLASTYMETGVAANIRTHLVHSHPRIHELPRGELRSILAHGANEDSHLAVLYSFGSCSNQATSARHTESAARWLARYFGCTRVISLTDFLSVPSSISPPNATNDTVQIYFRLHALPNGHPSERDVHQGARPNVSQLNDLPTHGTSPESALSMQKLGERFLTNSQHQTFVKDSWDLQHLDLSFFTQGKPEPSGVEPMDPDTYAFWPGHHSVLYLYLPNIKVWVGYLQFHLLLESPSPHQKVSLFVQDTFIREHLRRRGLGQFLLEAAHRLAFQLRCAELNGHLFQEGGQRLWRGLFGQQLIKTFDPEHKVLLHQ